MKFISNVLHEKLSLPKTLHTDLLHTALALEKLDDAGIKWCKKNYKNGYTSYGSLDRLYRQHTVFESFEKALHKKIQKLLSKTNLNLRMKDLEMTTCWVNVMHKGTKHAYHVHPHSVISGTYYLQTPKGSSPLCVKDPRGVETKFNAKAGDLILFESWVNHEVPLFNGTSPRVGISFNYERV